jgi:hypothetical protein
VGTVLTHNLPPQHFIFLILDQNGYAPLQISRKRRGQQSRLQAGVNDLPFMVDDTILGPLALLTRFFDPFFCRCLDLVECEVGVG